MLRLALPFPPTVNNLFVNARGKGRVPSPGYAAWKREAAFMLGRPDTVRGPYHLTLIVQRPDRRRRDLDNLIKPLSDALVACGAVEDDSDCVSLLIKWAEAPGSAPVTAEIVPMGVAA